MNEKGRIVKIWSDIVEIEFSKNSLPSIDHLLTLHDGKTYLLVQRIVDETTIRAIIIYTSQDISINDEVINTKHSFAVPIGKESKNNIYNFWGLPLLKNRGTKPKYIEMNSIINKTRYLGTNNEIIETGIKEIDFFIPYVKVTN